MSVRAISWVFTHFKAEERGNRMAGQVLVMLAIADSAEDDGRDAFPGVDRLAAKTRMSRRQVMRVLDTLVDEGHLVRERRTRRHHHDRYSIAGMLPPGDVVSPGDQVPSVPDQVTSTTRTGDMASLRDPATRPRDVRVTRPIAPTSGRRRDPLFEAVMEACGVEWREGIPDSARGAYNRALADLRKLGATPEEVHRRAANVAGAFTLTPTALARRWAELDRTWDARPGSGRVRRIMDEARREAEAGR